MLLFASAVPASPQAHFEIASIRPSQPGLTACDARFQFHGDRFEVKAGTASDILDMLGGFQLFRVVGGPDWMRTGDETYSIRMDHGDVVLTRVSMPGITNYLSQMLKAPVVDETGLKGNYDFILATSEIESQRGNHHHRPFRRASFGVVSGHGFSRADALDGTMGFSP